MKLFKEVLKNQYSVRKVEEMVQMLKNGEDVQGANRKIAAKAKLPAEYDAVKKRLTTFFQTKIQMTCSPTGKGKISIPFDNERDLERILKVLNAGH